MSHASGIPTFRGTDPGAIWKKDVTELGTRRFFESDPAGSWSWYTSRFDMVLDKRPNPAHRALAALERWHVEPAPGASSSSPRTSTRCTSARGANAS